MRIFPAWSVAILALSLSVATTSCPASARQLPDTSPTYPQPITANFTLILPLKTCPIFASLLREPILAHFAAQQKTFPFAVATQTLSELAFLTSQKYLSSRE